MRFAILTDVCLDEQGLIEAAEHVGGSVVAVMVLPPHFEMSRTCVPPGVRCVTHPNELRAIGIDVCVSRQADGLLARHGAALSQFTELRSFPRDPLAKAS
jgi:hypothetical protein